MYPLPHSSYVALRGRLELPADGLWHVRTPTDETVVQIYLTPPSEIGRRLQGRRMTAALRQQRIDQGQWKVRMPYQACLSFARAHNATGPAAVGELDTEEHRYVVENLQSYPPWWNWDEAADGERPDGPFVFLVPSAPSSISPTPKSKWFPPNARTAGRGVAALRQRRQALGAVHRRLDGARTDRQGASRASSTGHPPGRRRR
jgi:hypothetical protein